MKENKDIEKILLNDENYENFITKKTEKEFEDILSKSNSHRVITDIKKLTPEQLFSRKSTFIVINKASKTKSFVNGLQAEGLLGDQLSVREKLVTGAVNSFVNESYFVKFYEFNG